jgi:hypothetical protein
MTAFHLCLEVAMHRFIEGADRAQASLLPASLEDYVDADNPVRVIEAFVDALDLDGLGFAVIPAATGRPGYHPAMLLKLYIYGYCNRVQSSRRLERECQRNIELMWLTGRLAPDPRFRGDKLQDHRRLPSRQRSCDLRGLRPVYRHLPRSRPVQPAIGGDRWQQV